jgi:hypothetical protein
MEQDFDVNKLVAEFLNQNIENILALGKGVLKGATDRIRLRLMKSYGEYLLCVAERYSKSKSFFIRNEPANLYDFYVPVGISSPKADLATPTMPSLAAVSNCVVITGSGGSGKSMLMRHLFLNTLDLKKKVPVFLELRELNQKRRTIQEFLNETLSSNKFTLDDEYIQKALKSGHFALFLDGFDEIGLTIRNAVSNDIRQLAKKYDGNIFIVSSRPDNDFAGWQNFSTLHIKPLNIDQACELIEKLPFDADLKTKFLRDLKSDLFKKHESFLSNPLLLSIMLLTYGQSADIPTKLSIFYNQAYEALFQRHDALKGGFQRDRRTKLDIQDFQKVFSAFCIQTYDKRAFQFSKSDALDYLEQAKKITGLDFDTTDFLTDSLQAVCLLVEEGLMFVFSHRSFQEYFVARFVRQTKPEIQERLISKYCGNFLHDEVMHLLYEMNPEVVERGFVLPYLDKLAIAIGVKNRLGITHYLRYLKSQYRQFILDGNEITGYRHSNFPYNRVVYFALVHSGSLLGWKGFQRDKQEVAALFKKHGKGPHVTAKMTIKDPFIRDLATKGQFFSQNTLELALKIKSALVEKHRRNDKTIDELLLTD